MVRVFPHGTRPRNVATEVRLYAAGGERESFQVCIQPKHDAAEGITIETGKRDDAIPPPDVRIVGFLAVQEKDAAIPLLFPDPLLEVTPLSIAPGEIRTFWITYTIPPNVPPGLHKSTVTVVCGKKRIVIPVSLNVFAFTLPDTPTLRSGFTLDRNAIRTVYGIDDTTLEAWKPIYNALADERIAYRIWDGDDMVAGRSTNTPRTERLKEHLDYLVNRAHMNTIDIGAGSLGVTVFPVPPEGELTDPLQPYLFDMAAWLMEKGWIDRAFIETTQIGERVDWQAERDASFRVKRNDPRIKRLIRGPVHPYFERYTEMWAVPQIAYTPYAEAAFREGHSLIEPGATYARTVTASSSSINTAPEDGYDGCVFSAWISKGTPTKKNSEWIQFDFALPVNANHLKVIWRNTFEGTDVELALGNGGQFTEPREITWKACPPPGGFMQSWAEIQWRFPERFDSLRLTFHGSLLKGPVGLTDLVIGDPLPPAPPDTIPPISTWLYAPTGIYPSIYVNAHPVEARLFPWICWGAHAEGFLSEGLNQWPGDWTELAQTQPQIWPTHQYGKEALFYPGRTAPTPSIRSMLLRDGMEDYEYLVLMEKAMTKKNPEEKTQALANICAHIPLNPAPSRPELDQLATRIAKDRITIGEALSGSPKKNKISTQPVKPTPNPQNNKPDKTR